MDAKIGVSLFAIMKNEYDSILEWVVYHRTIGFGPIVVYSNDCSDGSVELLDGLERCGVVTHRRQETPTHMPTQHAAYKHAIATAVTPWACFIDADEFFVCKKDATIQGFLARFDANVSAIAVNWRLFGSSGQRVHRPGLVIERFTRASARDYETNRHFKSVVRVSDVERMAAHLAVLKRGDYANADGQPIHVGLVGQTDRVAAETAQINHYCVKSLEEFELKKNRGRVDTKRDDPDKYTKFSARDGADYLRVHDRNDEEDLALFSHLGEVRKEITRLIEALRRIGVPHFS